MRVHHISSNIHWNPKQRLKMLFGQPNLVLDSTGHGYRQAQETAERQVNTIREIFKLCLGGELQCVVFPEFSLPLSMLVEVREAISDGKWPNNSVFISGVETLSPADFSKLLQESDNPEGFRELNVDKSTFVNFCCIWVKDSIGTLRVYYQPKLKPSAPEQATQGMYEGDFVFLFSTDILNFAAIVCFDCIATDGSVSTLESVLRGICQLAPAGSLVSSVDLHLLFVPQHNPKAEHKEFLGCAEKLFAPRERFNNAHCSIAFINSAHKLYGRAIKENYGRSALYYRQGGPWRGCKKDGPLTVIPQTFALEDIQNTLVRARFREDGPSVHEFEYLIPTYVGGQAADPRYPLHNAVRFRIRTDGTLDAPVQVPALRKVIFDWLLDKYPDTDSRFVSAVEPVKARLIKAYGTFCKELNEADESRIEEITTLLFCAAIPPASPADINPDTWQSSSSSDWWNDTSGQAFLELASITVLLGLLRSVNIRARSRVQMGLYKDGSFAVLSGREKFDWMTVYRAYLTFLRKNSWIDLVGRTNLLFFAQVTADPTHGDKIDVPDFFDLSTDDLNRLPNAVKPRPEDTTYVGTRFRAVSASACRGALLRPDEKMALEFLENILGN